MQRLRVDSIICCVRCSDFLYVHWRLRFIYLQIFQRMQETRFNNGLGLVITKSLERGVM